MIHRSDLDYDADARDRPPEPSIPTVDGTAWGNHLAPPVHALVRWGAQPTEARDPDVAFRGQWFALPITTIFDGFEASRPRFAAQIWADDQSVTFEFVGGPSVAPLRATRLIDPNLAPK